MKIAIILDPLDAIKTYKDTTYAMMVEAAARGHQLHVLMRDGVMWKQGRVIGESRRLELTGEKERWYRIDPPREDALSDFDAVLMRKDPPFDMEYVTATWLLELAGREGARVFNDPRALRDHSEKLAIAEFPQFTAPSLVSRMERQIHQFIDEHTDVVVKPLDGMGGAQIFRVTKTDPNRNVIVETLTWHGTRSIMAQRYIPEISAGDKRILLIAGEPVPYSLARIPKAGETRGNLAVGGTGVAQPLSSRDREIATALGPVLARRGLLLVGLDAIGDYLTEINVTSPTCFREIHEQTGCNVAALFIDALEKACAQPR
ncbi:MAG: glutathione synthase [Betaproteobacteria bacterium]|nr:MAG: glutathione synthase [Betaproteobacteria bacterium]